jgi:hypothetical protein
MALLMGCLATLLTAVIEQCSAFVSCFAVCSLQSALLTSRNETSLHVYFQLIKYICLFKARNMKLKNNKNKQTYVELLQIT